LGGIDKAELRVKVSTRLSIWPQSPGPSFTNLTIIHQNYYIFQEGLQRKETSYWKNNQREPEKPPVCLRMNETNLKRFED
jgi:hypothetical protein